MSKVYVGIDNGSSGTIGIIGLGAPKFFKPPVKVEQDYTKKAQNITRIDQTALEDLLMQEICRPIMEEYQKTKMDRQVVALVERPFVNPGMFRTTVCAVRAFEATIITLERLSIPWEPVDSKIWQKEMLPEGLKGAPKLKKASRDIGMRAYPSLAEQIKKHGDADGLLIASWGNRVHR